MFEGVIESKENQYNLVGSQNHTYRCPNCRKNMHCIGGYKEEGDPVELLKDRCGKGCECRCRTHFIAKNGRLKKYGTVDDTDVLEGFTKTTGRNETDDLIDELNAQIKGETNG